MVPTYGTLIIKPVGISTLQGLKLPPADDHRKHGPAVNLTALTPRFQIMLFSVFQSGAG